MGELARRRRARDLWISRSHVWAMAVGVVLIGVIVFSLGATLMGGPATTAGATTAPPSDESLVDLLARVDARSVAQDGVDTLTFPDTLSGVADEPSMPTVAPAVTQQSAVAPGAVGLRPFDLVLHAQDDAQAATLAAQLVGSGWHARVESADGVARVIVDGGSDLATARENEQRLRERLLQLSPEATPELRPR